MYFQQPGDRIENIHLDVAEANAREVASDSPWRHSVLFQILEYRVLANGSINADFEAATR